LLTIAFVVGGSLIAHAMQPCFSSLDEVLELELERVEVDGAPQVLSAPQYIQEFELRGYLQRVTSSADSSIELRTSYYAESYQ